VIIGENKESIRKKREPKSNVEKSSHHSGLSPEKKPNPMVHSIWLLTWAADTTGQDATPTSRPNAKKNRQNNRHHPNYNSHIKKIEGKGRT